MITFLVVGRNDGYGINLHKRTAISLNHMATHCTDPDDEIIYVDCNTPSYDQTLAEAIADTLTREARARLRVFRITKEQMYGAIGETPLPFSDELSRNVGIRRSNPKNKWLLSTNCDVLLQPITNDSFNQVLQKLKLGFYVCPRIEVPIYQWQMLNRTNIAQINHFGDEVIMRGARMPPEKEDWLRFAAVGDFQLAPREQWFQIGGCEEGMKFWGHSDVNNSKRLSILNGGGKTPDLGNDLRVIHLEHNPRLETAHNKTMVHNDWNRWVEEVKDYKSRNSINWGLADAELQEIRLEATDLSSQAILTTNPRQRTFLKKLKLRFLAGFWRVISGIVNKVDRDE